jgi:diaminopimelate epimerase
VGADGVLAGDPSADPPSLRIFNPDGGEAEKSGNGLRIYGAWLHGRGHVRGDTFRVALPAETVEMTVEAVGDDGARTIRVAMGRASFRAGDVGYAGADPDAEVMGEPLATAGSGPGAAGGGGEPAVIHLVSMGNPHCVVFVDDLDPGDFRRRAPLIQAHPAFERGVNVQFARPTGPGVLEARVWERGAGETLASGSSACAVAAAARRAGILEGEAFEVRMAGGSVRVALDEAWNVALTGPAVIVFEGRVEGTVLRGSGIGF